MSRSASNAPRVYLASASPRRRELLSQLGVDWELAAVEVDERISPGESPGEYVSRVARLKAAAASALITRTTEDIVVAADTTVALGTEIFGKPADRDDCRRILSALAARTHEVYTSVVLAAGGRSEGALSRSEVSFREIDSAEIDAYWASGEPCDKAGGYAIQGLGAAFVRDLRGSYSGVMGLPLFETARLLKGFGLDVLRLARAHS
jgi:septum formation protein